MNCPNQNCPHRLRPRLVGLFAQASHVRFTIKDILGHILLRTILVGKDAAGLAHLYSKRLPVVVEDWNGQKHAIRAR